VLIERSAHAVRASRRGTARRRAGHRPARGVLHRSPTPARVRPPVDAAPEARRATGVTHGEPRRHEGRRRRHADLDG